MTTKAPVTTTHDRYCTYAEIGRSPSGLNEHKPARSLWGPLWSAVSRTAEWLIHAWGDRLSEIIMHSSYLHIRQPTYRIALEDSA